MGRPSCRPVGRLSGPDHVRGDAGGVWIVTGWVLGGLVYVGVVVAWHAGFTAAAPFVIIPAVLVVMIGGGNLLSGKRSGRPAPRFNRPDPVPLSSLRGEGAPPAGPDGAARTPADGPPPGGGRGADGTPPGPAAPGSGP
jgi:hypothetical protein